MPYQLRISLDRTLVWRSVIVSETLTLGSLHLVIQQAMGWENRHLFIFKVGQERYGPDDLDEESITLKQVFKGSTKTVRYIYDFGDWWEHTITLEQTRPKMATTLVVAGEGDCPAEDSGGVDR